MAAPASPRSLVVLSLLAALVAACGEATDPEAVPSENASSARFAAVTAERLIAADSEPGQWLSHGRTYGEQRFSPLAEIDTRNVAELGLEWYADFTNGRAQESLGWFDQALADPNYPTPAAAWGNAGTCANRAGQADRAEANWRQALALDAADLQSLAGMATLQFARNQYLDARAFAERWLAIAPSDAEGLQLASRIEQKLGDNVAAQRYLSRLQATSPGTSTVPRAQ